MVQRQALTSFEFSDGLYVPRGDWVCVPIGAMMADSQNYDTPTKFDPFRSLRNGEERAKPSRSSERLVDSSDKWLIWGAGRIQW